MSKRSTHENNYPFYWLDEIVEVTLNPAKSNVKQLPPEVLESIRHRLPDEISRITACLKTQAFSLYNSDHLRVFAGQYDQAVRLLRQQANENLSGVTGRGVIRKTCQQVALALNDLAAAMYRRFPDYLADPAEMESQLPAMLFKTLIKLSGDQIGIIIRAAFEGDLIDRPSKRAAYKALAPFIATPYRERLSGDSLRSNAGQPEEKDLNSAIAALERLIAIIKGFYRRR